ncbi:zinc ribbon domain-containing protein [Paenibacillus sp. y28]|uniref:zinc ribbon domain-containing protein n=1 Tax=Paenibacillus sp. y28 TaxID=3129110 RepID=UPI0030194F4A
MSFLKKIKDGASAAKSKAQQTVDVTRLSAQISTHRRDIERAYAAIGEEMYQAYLGGGDSNQESAIKAQCELIDDLYAKIKALDLKIADIKGEKLCHCGTIVQKESKFCPSCGISL